MKRVKWVFYYRLLLNSEIVIFDEGDFIRPERSALYAKLTKLLSNDKIESIGYIRKDLFSTLV